MKFGLTAYGTVYAIGIAPEANRRPITPIEQMEMAASYRLQGVEIPYELLKRHDPDETAEYARNHGMFITIAASGTDPAVLKEAIKLGSRTGARVVRTVVGGAKIGGDRRHMTGVWQPFLKNVMQSFREVIEDTDPHAPALAVENHQDLASEELLWLCENIGSDRFGITLDTGNPLATAELPAEFYRKVAPYVKNVHLKDYKMFWSEEGYRLARCPLGQGVIDFPELLRILSESAPPELTLSVEHGALEARHIRVLEEDYWTEYPKRSAVSLVRLLQFADRSRSKGDFRTPFELGESPEAIAAYEMKELEQGIAYLAPLMKQFG
jgi:3-oxoisoapionate decarboxylase